MAFGYKFKEYFQWDKVTLKCNKCLDKRTSKKNMDTNTIVYNCLLFLVCHFHDRKNFGAGSHFALPKHLG